MIMEMNINIVQIMNIETKQMLLSLLEGIPDDTILMRTLSDPEFTCKVAKEDLESENSKLFFSNLFRVSRDILIRQANDKRTKINQTPANCG